MKFLDKVKNMFTEVVEEEEKKDEVKIEKIEPEKNENKALEEFNKIKPTEIKEERKPVFFTDDDFNDLDSYFTKEEPVKQTKEESRAIKETSNLSSKEKKDYDPLASANDYLEKYNEEYGQDNEPYSGNIKIETKTSKFRPTPIISPVYGILDKNYHKEDIVSKNDPEYKSVDGLSVDSIRDKAYGTLEDELENTLFGSNSFLFKDSDKKEDSEEFEKEFFDEVKEETDIVTDDIIEDQNKGDDDLKDLENITMDIGKELDTLLNKDTKEDIDFNEVDDTNDDTDDDLFNLIDTMYDGDDK